MVQSRAHYLSFHHVGRTVNVVLIADLGSLDSEHGKAHCRGEHLWGLNAQALLLLKAEGAMDSKLEKELSVGIWATRGAPEVLILRCKNISVVSPSTLNLLEGLIQAVPRDRDALGRCLCRKCPLPPSLTEKSCPFICCGVGFLVRFHVQKEFCCSKQKFTCNRDRPLASCIQTTRASKAPFAHLVWRYFKQHRTI